MIWLKSSLVHTLCLSFCLLSTFAFANDQNIESQLRKQFQVEKYKLDNGLTVILHKDDAIPMVSFHIWYRVGSKDEKPGRTGLAHFFEHLMFKGTEKHTSTDFENLVTGSGGTYNAFTSRDYTGYYTLIPNDKLEGIMDMESDRMVNLKFDLDQINSEREVVKEERRMRYDNNPNGAMYELMNHTVFKTSPYHWPVIGYMKDLNATTEQNFRDFYKTYYAPNNAFIVVTGSFDKSEIKSMIKSYFGGLKPSKIPARNYTKEVEQKSRRYGTRKLEIQAPKLTIAYPGPDAFSKDEPALQMLASILGGGTSSRLYKKLVREKQWVTSISADMSSGILSGSFSFWTDLKPGKSISRVQSVILSEVNKLKNKKVSDVELTKVKNQVMLGYAKALDGIAGKARILAYSEMIYEDPTQFFKDLDEYQSVTAEDIQRVAKKYLTTNKQSILKVLPK